MPGANGREFFHLFGPPPAPGVTFLRLGEEGQSEKTKCRGRQSENCWYLCA